MERGQRSALRVVTDYDYNGFRRHLDSKGLPANKVIGSALQESGIFPLEEHPTLRLPYWRLKQIGAGPIAGPQQAVAEGVSSGNTTYHTAKTSQEHSLSGLLDATVAAASTPKVVPWLAQVDANKHSVELSNGEKGLPSETDSSPREKLDKGKRVETPCSLPGQTPQPEAGEDQGDSDDPDSQAATAAESEVSTQADIVLKRIGIDYGQFDAKIWKSASLTRPSENLSAYMIGDDVGFGKTGMAISILIIIYMIHVRFDDVIKE
ncbi:Uu.00g122120.m01.CDS01 [Anthostomella pinea]|uniref:Uu.00g122120.m01.CDS01 n=1 Tax=Anthostomella pinea TaxID=933095 RepID=A0AAI8VH62_9PEZI|nr:Uu.00g122120.m01.CDS01 [Anthostomella pinea]